MLFFKNNYSSYFLTKIKKGSKCNYLEWFICLFAHLCRDSTQRMHHLYNKSWKWKKMSSSCKKCFQWHHASSVCFLPDVIWWAFIQCPLCWHASLMWQKVVMWCEHVTRSRCPYCSLFHMTTTTAGKNSHVRRPSVLLFHRLDQNDHSSSPADGYRRSSSHVGTGSVPSAKATLSLHLSSGRIRRKKEHVVKSLLCRRWWPRQPFALIWWKYEPVQYILSWGGMCPPFKSCWRSCYLRGPACRKTYLLPHYLLSLASIEGK